MLGKRTKIKETNIILLRKKKKNESKLVKGRPDEEKKKMRVGFFEFAFALNASKM